MKREKKKKKDGERGMEKKKTVRGKVEIDRGREQ